MTDDKNRQEGAPVTDQDDTTPIKEEPAGITVDTGDNVDSWEWGARLPDDFTEYMRTHPGALDEFRNAIINAASPALKAAQEMAKATSAALSAAHYISNLQSNVAQIAQAIARASSLIPEWATEDELDAFFDELDELEPYLNAEIKKYPEYEGKTFFDVLNILPFGAIYNFIAEDKPEIDPGTDQEPAEGQEPAEDGAPLSEELQKIYDTIDDLLEIRRAARAARIAQKALENAPQRTIQHTDTVGYPLDKPNSIIWNLLEKDTAGQISFNLAKAGTRQVIPAYYSINFDNLGNDIKITKRLTAFDKRVYIAISALFCAGNDVITLNQIYYAMGYKGNPGPKDYGKINESITKMTTARIFFDNEMEAKKYKYDRFQYDGSLLPIERGTGIINGKVADAAIYVFRDPPLMTFAKQRGQITTIDIKLLQSPVSKTNDNLLIEDYLIERICRAKNSKQHRRTLSILLKTLYDRAGITTKKQKQRAPAKVRKYLEHQQKEGLFSRYELNDEKIIIHFTMATPNML